MKERLKLLWQLERCEPVRAWEYRPVTGDDIPALGELMLAAYQGTVDYEGESIEQAIAEVRGTFAGRVGRFLADCSLCIEQGDGIASACLVTLVEDRNLPFLAFSMTRPEARSQGMAGVLIRVAGNRLLDAGHRQLALVVTSTNEPAVHLYQKLGFKRADDID